MPTIHEIADDVFRISVHVPEINLEFSHFLVRDEEPLLFHTGLRGMFPALREAVGKVIDPGSLRWIGFSHFESDECGALNEWLAAAPNAQPVHGMLGMVVNLNDFSNKPGRMLMPEDRLVTGKHKYRFIHTPHVPHGWDAGVLYEENKGTLFCSDLFHQWGLHEPVTDADLTERARATLLQSEAGPFANYIPYNENTGRVLHSLSELDAKTLAIMHGSSYSGNCSAAFRNLATVMREVYGQRAEGAAG
jgi:flavorubredoxin